MNLKFSIAVCFAFFAVVVVVADETSVSESNLNNSTSLAELERNNPELDVETNANLTSEDDALNANRDKRTLGTMIQGVADLFGYDLLKRPSAVKEQRTSWFPPVLSPLPVERQSASSKSTMFAIIPQSALFPQAQQAAPTPATIHLQVHQQPAPPAQVHIQTVPVQQSQPQVQFQPLPQPQQVLVQASQPQPQQVLAQQQQSQIPIQSQAQSQVQNQQQAQSQVQQQPQSQSQSQIQTQPQTSLCVNFNTASAHPCLQGNALPQAVPPQPQSSPVQPCLNAVPVSPQAIAPCLQSSAVQPCLNSPSESRQGAQPCLQASPVQPCLGGTLETRQSAQPCLQASPVQPCLNGEAASRQAVQPCLQASPVQPCLNAARQNSQAVQPCLNGAPANPQQQQQPQSQNQAQSLDSSSSQDFLSSEFGSLNALSRQLNAGALSPCGNANVPSTRASAQPCLNAAAAQPCAGGPTGAQLQTPIQFQTDFLQPALNLQAGLQFQPETRQGLQPCAQSESFQPCVSAHAASDQPCAHAVPLQSNLNAAPCSINFQALQPQLQLPLAPARSLSETVRRLFNLNFSFNRGLGAQSPLVRPPLVLSSINRKASAVVSPCLKADPVAKFAPQPSTQSTPITQINPSSSRSSLFNSLNTLEDSRLYQPKSGHDKTLQKISSRPKITSNAPNNARSFTSTSSNTTTTYTLKNTPKLTPKHTASHQGGERLSIEGTIASLESIPISDERARASLNLGPASRYDSSPLFNAHHSPQQQLRNSINDFWVNNPSRESRGYKYMVTTNFPDVNELYGDVKDKLTATKRSNSENVDSNISMPQSFPEKVSFFRIPAVDDDEFVTIAQQTENEINKNKQRSRNISTPEFHKKYQKTEVSNPVGLVRVEEKSKKLTTLAVRPTEPTRNPKNEAQKRTFVTNEGLDLSRLRQKSARMGKDSQFPQLTYTKDPSFDSLVQSIERIYKTKQPSLAAHLQKNATNNSTIAQAPHKTENNKNLGRGNVKFQEQELKNPQSNNAYRKEPSVVKVTNQTYLQNGNVPNGIPNKNINANIPQRSNSKEKTVITLQPNQVNGNNSLQQVQPAVNETIDEHKWQMERQKAEIKRLQNWPMNDGIHSIEGLHDDYVAVARKLDSEIERHKVNQDSAVPEHYENIEVTDPTTNTKERKKVETHTKKYLEKIEDPTTHSYEESTEKVEKQNEKENEEIESYANLEMMSKEHEALINNITIKDPKSSDEQQAVQKVQTVQKPLPAAKSVTKLPHQVELIKTPTTGILTTTQRNDFVVTLKDIQPNKAVLFDYKKWDLPDGLLKGKTPINQKQAVETVTQVSKVAEPGKLAKPAKFVIQQVDKNTDFEIMSTTPRNTFSIKSIENLVKDKDSFDFANWENKLDPRSKENYHSKENQRGSYENPSSLENYQSSFEKSQETHSKENNYPSWGRKTNSQQRPEHLNRYRGSQKFAPPGKSYSFKLTDKPNSRERTKSSESKYNADMMSLEQPRSIESDEDEEIEPLSYEYTAKFEPMAASEAKQQSKALNDPTNKPVAHYRTTPPEYRNALTNTKNSNKNESKPVPQVLGSNFRATNLPVRHSTFANYPTTLSDYGYGRLQDNDYATTSLYHRRPSTSSYNSNNYRSTERIRQRPQTERDFDYSKEYKESPSPVSLETDYFKSLDDYEADPPPKSYYNYKTIPDDYNVYKPPKQEEAVQNNEDAQDVNRNNHRRVSRRPAKYNITVGGPDESAPKIHQINRNLAINDRSRRIRQRNANYLQEKPKWSVEHGTNIGINETPKVSTENPHRRRRQPKKERSTIASDVNNVPQRRRVSRRPSRQQGIQHQSQQEQPPLTTTDASNSFIAGSTPAQLNEPEIGEQLMFRPLPFDIETLASEKKTTVVKYDLGDIKRKTKKVTKYDIKSQKRAKRHTHSEEMLDDEEKERRRRRRNKKKRPAYYDEKEFEKERNKDVRTLDYSGRRPRRRKSRRGGSGRSFSDVVDGFFDSDEEKPFSNGGSEGVLDKLSQIKVPKAKPVDYSQFEKFNVQDDEQGLSPKAYVKSKESKTAYIFGINF
ncbi:uncharacterized protein LOC108735073 [Agrilus planipennis]|uniref:Uncharacterized protein LOC108735073 n=1 Tax=Agrilus planipennis TaxID=224129 RepID=A0A1W4WPI4_AGRPL|nr:uncharacterized protein LOC108735073 [Agrilus planipennis]